MRTDISKYSLHDYSYLIREWKALAKESGLKIARIGKVDGFPIFKIYSSPKSLSHCIYLSAGIHGDEPAGCHGLLQWARLYLKRFFHFPILIFPCLNPWGLVNNQRFNSSGIDLNRAWGLKTEPLILCMHQHLEGLHFSLSLHLHEDFDGQGIYLYEPQNRSAKVSIANEVLDAAAQIIARDPRAVLMDARLCRGLFVPAQITNLPEDCQKLCFYLNKPREPI